MNFFAKNRLITWLLILLIIVNISALVSFLIFSREKPRPTTQDSPITRQYFMRELSLTTSQDSIVRKINSDYQQAAMPVADSIKSVRMELLDELSGSSPDTTRLKEIKDRLCAWQTRLQDIGIDQYLSLKKICTPGQAKSLSIFYEKLYGCDSTCRRMGPGHSPNNEHGKGMRHRYRGNRSGRQ